METFWMLYMEGTEVLHVKYKTAKIALGVAISLAERTKREVFILKAKGCVKLSSSTQKPVHRALYKKRRKNAVDLCSNK